MNHNDQLPLVPNSGSIFTANNDIQFVDMEALAKANLQTTQLSTRQEGYLPTFATIAENRMMCAQIGFNQNISHHSKFVADSHGDVLAKEPYFSENGIPPQLLDEIFQLEDDMKARGKRSGKFPVKPHQTMEDYEKELVAEMESLFPSTTPKSRLMQELTKNAAPGSPCPMNLHFRGGHNVDLVDSHGRQYRARFSGSIPAEKINRLIHRQSSVPIKSHDNRSAVYTELIKPTHNCGISEATIAVGKPKTIVIKAPKRTIASSVGEEIDKNGPNSRIKNLTDGGSIQHGLSVIDSTPMKVPMLPSATASSSGKQPRKQKLKSLSECEVIFKETLCEHQAGFVEEGETSGAVHPRVMEKNTNIVTQPHQQQRNQPIITRTVAEFERILPFKKRIGTTHYRIQGSPECKQLPDLPTDPIEIIDSSDDSDEAQATHSYPKKVDNQSKTTEFDCNTDSVQCPICFKVFFSTDSLMQHSQRCMNAMLEQRNQTPSSSKMVNKMQPDKPSDGGQFPPPKRMTSKQSLSDKQPPPVAKKKRPSAGQKRCERLSIEILPTAFNTANLLLCIVCQKSFRTQEHLEMHKRIHKAPTVCQYCKKKFYETSLKHVCNEKRRSAREAKRKTRR